MHRYTLDKAFVRQSYNDILINKLIFNRRLIDLLFLVIQDHCTALIAVLFHDITQLIKHCFELDFL